jgi:hypothetical protein
MSAENQTQPEKRAAGAKHPVGILLRLILAALAGILIGSVVYFTAVGWIPYLDQRVFQPIDANQAKINDLLERQSTLETQLGSLQNTLDANDLAAGPQGTAAALQSTLEILGESVQESQGDITNNTNLLLQYTQSLATLITRQNETDRNLSALATAQMASLGTKQDIELLKVLDLFNRASQYLLYADYGLAEDELVAASTKLDTLLETAPAYQQAAIAEILDLVNGAISDLPARPEVAGEKIQLAWQLAVSGLPQSGENPEGTITPTPYLTPTP